MLVLLPREYPWQDVLSRDNVGRVRRTNSDNLAEESCHLTSNPPIARDATLVTTQTDKACATILVEPERNIVEAALAQYPAEEAFHL